MSNLADTVWETEWSLIRGVSGWSWWEFHKTPDKNWDSLILHRFGVSIKACAKRTTQTNYNPDLLDTNTINFRAGTEKQNVNFILNIWFSDIFRWFLSRPWPIITSPALHSTTGAQCQHGEESIDKEFDPGVICLHYTIFSRTVTFSLLSHHKTFKCSQDCECEGAVHVMCGRGEWLDHSTRDQVSRAESNWWGAFDE